MYNIEIGSIRCVIGSNGNADCETNLTTLIGVIVGVKPGDGSRVVLDPPTRLNGNLDPKVSQLSLSDKSS